MMGIQGVYKLRGKIGGQTGVAVRNVGNEINQISKTDNACAVGQRGSLQVNFPLIGILIVLLQKIVLI